MSLFLLATSKPRQHTDAASSLCLRRRLRQGSQAGAPPPCRRILRLEIGGYACFGFAGDLGLLFSLLFNTTHSGLAMKMEE